MNNKMIRFSKNTAGYIHLAAFLSELERQGVTYTVHNYSNADYTEVELTGGF